MEQNKLDKIHSIQLEMLRSFHEYCNSHGIRYTVICGTLLGTIRHKGFIPWDDDIDVGLLREDYEKLIKFLQEEPIEGCFIQDYSTDSHYYMPYAKLVKEGTVFVEEYRKNCKAKNGLFIDIFPFDSIREPGLKSTKLRRMIARLLTFAVWSKEECHMERKGNKKLINLVSAVVGVLPKQTLINIQNKLVIRNHDDWEYLASMFSSNYDSDRLYFKKTDFDNLIELPFEDIVVNAPSNWEENLKRLYKNYMALPPEDKRNSGHDVYKISI
ncbi:lipopolysaccharide cholinephosphotransferase [Pseudobutyrivibrio sp. ACV-2]|uniref:LicD family protein n=1 Tax=Pseudobutyrivibrio sp. ACV-2 TaxID=1520801 RepID=UPI000896F844|nr:LicD family protein [Pseudobutyrivibrio sp. ACV-2]SEA02121.1 lipopolysaccharide cholinephosphotransferase [Pseudobutyrivibrio sp. ACV-2]